MTDIHTHPDEETIAAMIDGNLTPRERETLLRHLDACPECHQIFTETARFLTDEEDSHEETEPPEIVDGTVIGFPRRRLLITSSLLAAAALIVMVLIPNNDGVQAYRELATAMAEDGESSSLLVRFRYPTPVPDEIVSARKITRGHEGTTYNGPALGEALEPLDPIWEPLETLDQALNRISVYLLAGDYVSAIVHAEDTVKKWPKSWRAKAARALAMYAVGRTQGSDDQIKNGIEETRMLIKEHPDEPDLNYNLAIMLMETRAPDAEHAINQYLNLVKQGPHADYLRQ